MTIPIQHRTLMHLFRQQIDPIAFLEELRSQSVQESRRLWLVRLGMGLTVVALLGLIGLLNQDRWPVMVLYTVSASMLMQMAIGVTIMAMGYTRFWLTYLFSPPLLLIVLLCGLTPVTSIGWLGWLALPLALGHGVAVGGMVWLHKWAFEMEAYPSGLREGGIPADMPRLQWRIRVRVFRLALAGICLLGALLLLWLMPLPGTSTESFASLALLIGAVGCLSLDATLLSWLGSSPLLVYDERGELWHTSYSGRFALFAPPQQLHQLLATDDDAANVVLTLLRSSYLAPAVRRAVAMLTPVEAHHLLLSLSLQAGGARAIRYLLPTLPPSLHLVAQSYADLASEAAKPLDVQHWLTLLSTLQEATYAPSLLKCIIIILKSHFSPNSPRSTSERHSPHRPIAPSPPSSPPRSASERGSEGARGRVKSGQEIAQLLAEVHRALFSHKHSQQVDVAHDKLTHFVHTLDGEPKSNDSLAAPASWPIALLSDLDSHRTQLLSS